MRSVIFFLLIIGTFMIMHGIYEQKYKSLLENRRVEYKFLPRTYYEEQISDTDVTSKFKNMYNKDPWFERNVSIFPEDKRSNKSL